MWDMPVEPTFIWSMDSSINRQLILKINYTTFISQLYRLEVYIIVAWTTLVKCEMKQFKHFCCLYLLRSHNRNIDREWSSCWKLCCFKWIAAHIFFIRIRPISCGKLYKPSSECPIFIFYTCMMNFDKISRICRNSIFHFEF